MSKSAKHNHRHNQLYLGAHASITPTILAGLEFMTGLGANAIQIFAGPSQSSSIKVKQHVSPEQAHAIKSFISRTNTKLIIHAIYTLNLCAHPATSGRIKYALDNIIYDMELAERIGAMGVVIHLGSALQSPIDQAISNLISNIQHILDATRKTAPNIFLALETPAGQGKQVATMLDELAEVWSQLSKSNPPTSMTNRRLGICIDTAHIFSSGVDIRAPAIFQDYITRFDKLIGIQHIKCFHLNDSKAGLNSRRDIHEGLGDGYIFSAEHNPAHKLETIQHLLRLAKMHAIPVILETHSAGSPDKPNSVLYAQEIAKLLELASGKSRTTRSSWQLIHPASSQKRRASNLYNHKTKKLKHKMPHQQNNNFIIHPANLALITKLVQLQDYYTKIKQDKFRALAYGKAIVSLRAYPAQIVSASQVSSLHNIGPSIQEKITEYLETGYMTIFKAEDIQAKLDTYNAEQASNIINILGFGPARAKQLARHGIRTITQLQHALDNNNLTLTQQEQLGLKYHTDLAKTIPRTEAEKIFKSIQQVLKTSGILQRYGLTMELAGSYPSGKESSKDIDILIFTNKHPDPDTQLPAEIMLDIATSLKAAGSLLDIISQGSGKILGITQLNPGTSSARHIDIRLLPSGAQVFGRFYFTSGRVFNQMVRAYAKKQGYKLNESGLYDLRKKTPSRVPGLDSEEAIMAHIGLAFVPMNKRR